ncbi:MAG TPA: amidohydrolase family protein [Pseudolabrys sp.]|nr:amidohydrolase family protein [Pseudolabrys sp.]
MAANFPPPGAADCHVHVIGPKTQFPLAKTRTYTPMDAPTAHLAAMLKRLGLDRVVLVQPSFYGTDNACMLDCMAALPGSRGVAVLPAEVPGSALDDLHKRGVRGLRVNIATGGTASIEQMRDGIAAAAKLCARNGWHVQIFVPSSTLAPLGATLRALPVDTVVDHFGLIAPGEAPDTLVALLESGKVWVKISGAYRIAADPADPRIDPLARRLVATNPERAVWGSDWPHTPRHDLRKPGESEEMPFQNIDTRGLLDLVPRWLGDDALAKRVLVTNPERLYDF